MTTFEIVQKLWNLCNVLRDDGITYHQYVTELTYILFLKMAEETGVENKIPKGYRWADLVAKDGIEQYGKGKRHDQGKTGRFRCFTRGEIKKRNDSLDITWLQDDSIRNGEDLGDPADIAEEILAKLDLATQEMQELARLLEEVN